MRERKKNHKEENKKKRKKSQLSAQHIHFSLHWMAHSFVGTESFLHGPSASTYPSLREEISHCSFHKSCFPAFSIRFCLVPEQS
jgi:hypothetical protein